MADEELLENENASHGETAGESAVRENAVTVNAEETTAASETAAVTSEANGTEASPNSLGERKKAVADESSFSFGNMAPAWQPRRRRFNPLFIVLPVVVLLITAAAAFLLYTNLKTGWHETANGLCYRENLKKVTGLYSIDGVQYLFDADGYLLEGAAVYVDSIYFSTRDGIAKGDVSVDGTLYHFNDETGILYRGFYTLNEELYYSDDFGFPAPGLIEADGKLFYSAADGKISKGWESLEDGKRYFGTEDFSAAKGIFKIDNDTYIFDEKGILCYGLIQNDEYCYYADPESGVCLFGTRYLEEQDAVYCFDAEGKILNGIHKVDDKPWYFENNIAVTGWVADNTMYSTTEGLVSGTFYINGKKYLFDEDYILVTGWKKEGGVTRYYDYDGTMLVGWQDIIGKTYYFDKDGVLATGLTTIDNVLYSFNEDGSVHNGWTEVNGVEFWFNEKGAKTTGFAVVNGKLSYLSIYGGFIKAGWHDYRQRDFYVYEDGSVAIGLTELDGSKYYFGEDGYMAVKECVIIDGKRYYFMSDGKMAINTTVDGWIVDENGVAKATFSVILDDNLDEYLEYVIKQTGTDIKAIYNWVKKKVTAYSYYSAETVANLRAKGEYDKLNRVLAIEALNKGKGSCWHYAALTKLLLDKAGYTTEIVKGGGHSANEHNWVVVWDDNQWKHIDSMRLNSNVVLISDAGLKTYKFEYKNTETNRHGPHPEYNYTYTDCYYYGYTLPANP